MKVNYDIGGDILIYHEYISVQLSGNFQYINFATTRSIHLKCNAYFLTSRMAYSSSSRNLLSFSPYCCFPIFITHNFPITHTNISLRCFPLQPDLHDQTLLMEKAECGSIVIILTWTFRRDSNLQFVMVNRSESSI